MRDLTNNIAIDQSIVPAVYSADATGIGSDLQGFDSAVVEFTSGADVGSTHAPTVEESDTLGSGYTTVAAGDLEGTLPADMGATTILRVGYKGAKRFIRAFMTSSGASLAHAANVIKSKASQLPT